MIRLTVTKGNDATCYLFEKETVTLGACPTPEVDLSLPDLQPLHITIQEEFGRFFITNKANDPFATVNNQPFGKCAIQSHDVIRLGDIEICFEGTITSKSEPPSPISSQNEHDLVDTQGTLQDVLEEAICYKQYELESETQQGMTNEELERDQLEDLFREVEALQEAQVQPPLKQIPPPEATSSEMPKTYYVEEFDDESESWIGESVTPPTEPSSFSFFPRIFRTKRFYIILTGAVLLIACLATYLVYKHLQAQHHEDKLKAAEGVADVAMALAYAQVNNMKPQGQNWFDPAFLKTNLAALVRTSHASLANIDNQGHLVNCDYLLRVYTNYDMSHFVVIAQSDPSLVHWIVPKSAIVVDSRSMELRSVHDLRTLNRLLIDSNVLDSSSAEGVSYLIKQGELIPLSSLAKQKPQEGFSPPKILAYTHPGAENLIYNAPRYYHLGESLIEHAALLREGMPSNYDFSRLQHEAIELSRFPNLVLYSPGGMETVLAAQQVLAILTPGQFLTASLYFDENGSITNSHLILGPPSQEILSFDKDIDDNDDLPPANSDTASMILRQTNHPLLVRLQALTNARQQALKPISEKMVALLKNNTEKPVSDFKTSFDLLIQEYEKIDQTQHQIISEELPQLYERYGKVSMTQFAAYLRTAGVETIAKATLDLHAKNWHNQQLDDEQIQQQLEKVRRAASFEELDKAISETAEKLTLAHVSDPALLIPYQEDLHNLTLEKLNQFLLSSIQTLKPDAFRSSNRILLQRILQTAWIDDPEEKAFYLREFDRKR